MRDLGTAVERSILARRLLGRREGLLVAVSGGVDSMVLLRVLHELSRKHRWRIVVGHFNHRLRGADSDADERFAKRIAAGLRLKFVAGKGDVARIAREKKLSIETAARQLRHQFLANAARRLGVKIIALAHHADDQVELFLLRLLRGAGGEGLAGMKWRGPSPAGRGIRLIRPLLDQPKRVLHEYAETEGVGFREDASNVRTDMLRNRIRNKLIPLLRSDYQPGLAQTVRRAAEIVGAESDHACRAAKGWLKAKSRPPFAGVHAAVQRHIILIQLRKLGVAGDMELVERLRSDAGKAVVVAPSLSLCRDNDGIVRRQRRVADTFRDAEVSVALRGQGRGAVFGGAKLAWRIDAWRVADRGLPHFVSGMEQFDADKVGPSVVLRHWRAGDRFQPIGLMTTIKLQDAFTNLKIPRATRRRLVVATTAAGELFWVEGLRMGERFKLDNRTVRRLKWRCFRGETQVAVANPAC